jgi:uncharacterized protein YnzC (UPF0291/DUF896 family)
MSVRAEGSNAPLRRTDKKKIERIKKLAAKFVKDGLTEEKAEEKAREMTRDD